MSRENLPVGFSIRFQFHQSVYDVFSLKIQENSRLGYIESVHKNKRKVQQFLAYVVFCFPSEPNILEGPKYEKNINTILMYDVLTPVGTSR